MVAKKSKGWRSGKREVRSRMVQMTRHLVVSEGNETEPRYFEGVRAVLGAANERKNLVGMFEAVDDRRGEALQRAGRLVAYHRELGNIKPSAQNPSTKVGEIFDVIGPYLVG